MQKMSQPSLHYTGLLCKSNLKSEKGINADLGIATKIGIISYDAGYFLVEMSLMQLQVNTNIDQSVYLGTEQTLSLQKSPISSTSKQAILQQELRLSAERHSLTTLR